MLPMHIKTQLDVKNKLSTQLLYVNQLFFLSSMKIIELQ